MEESIVAKRGPNAAAKAPHNLPTYQATGKPVRFIRRDEALEREAGPAA
jgi:hypothetical protein